MPAWTLEHVTQTGTVLATLTPAARIEEVAWTLNEPGTLTFTLPVGHAQQTIGLMSEVRVRDTTTDRIVWWGFVARVDADPDRTRVQCVSLLGLFALRHMAFDAPDLLVNGGFEDLTGQTMTDGVGSTTPAGWTALAADGGSPPWARPVTTHRFGGQVGLRVESTQDGRDVWVGQTISGLTTGSAPKTYRLTADLHVCADSVDTGVYDSPPIMGYAYGWRLLSLIVIDMTTGQVMRGPDGGTVEAHYLGCWATGHHPGMSFTAADASAPMVRVTIPPGRTFALDCRLYAPRASVVWDNVRLVQEVGIDGDIGQDIAQLVRDVVTAAQDTTRGKTTLNITADVADTGVRRAVNVSADRDVKALDLLTVVAQQDQGIDLDVTWPDVAQPGTRTLTGWPQTQSDGRGRGTVTGITITAADCTTVTQWEDVTSAGNVVAAISPSPDGGMPIVGWASDLTTLQGVAVEHREQLPPGLSAEMVAEVAAKRLRQLRHGAQQLQVQLLPTSPARNVTVGDIVTVTMTVGRVQLSAAPRRVIAKRVDVPTGVVTLILAQGG